MKRRLKMKRMLVVALILALIGGAAGGAIAWANGGDSEPKGVLSIAELLGNPVYDTEVAIYGKVSLLGELFCPCFVLTSGGQEVEVWYGLMVDDDGAERPAVSVEGIENGDWVVVTGELKSDGTYRSLNDFWAASIVKCLGAAYTGEEVKVAVGDTLAIVLESNPTTGFMWVLADNSDEGVLQEAGHRFEADSTDPPPIGAGGVEVWTFKALAGGESTISMEYRRPWEQGVEPAETFTFTVVVE
jgi:inhibitor of cysteine peptidase